MSLKVWILVFTEIKSFEIQKNQIIPFSDICLSFCGSNNLQSVNLKEIKKSKLDIYLIDHSFNSNQPAESTSLFQAF